MANDLLMKLVIFAILGALIFYGSRLYSNVARKVPA